MKGCLWFCAFYRIEEKNSAGRSNEKTNHKCSLLAFQKYVSAVHLGAFMKSSRPVRWFSDIPMFVSGLRNAVTNRHERRSQVGLNLSKHRSCPFGPRILLHVTGRIWLWLAAHWHSRGAKRDIPSPPLPRQSRCEGACLLRYGPAVGRRSTPANGGAVVNMCGPQHVDKL